MNRKCGAILTWMLLLLVVMLPWRCYAEESTTKIFSQAEIEQMVAPIALYSDPLLAQVLMASTYPMEIISAANWIKDNPNLKGKELENALQKKTWDPSVKSLTSIPQVLNILSDKLEMTIKLGDAFLAQQQDVLNAIQSLRQRAKQAGNLNSSDQQVVNTEPYTEVTSQDTAIQETQQSISEPSYITIEPTNSEELYVPTYDPNTIYGSWPYSDYPPYHYYSSEYYLPGMGLAFSIGYILGDAAWGDVDWHGGDLTINHHRYNQYNRTNINNTKWEHDATHRKGLPYRDAGSQLKYADAHKQSAQIREAYRGHQALDNNRVDSIQQSLNKEQVRQERAHSTQNLTDKRFGVDQPQDHRALQQGIDQRQDNRGNQQRRDQLQDQRQDNRGDQQRRDQHQDQRARQDSRDIQQPRKQHNLTHQERIQQQNQRDQQDYVQEKRIQQERQQIVQQQQHRIEQDNFQQQRAQQQQQQRAQQQQQQRAQQQQQQRAQQQRSGNFGGQQQRAGNYGGQRVNAFEGVNHPSQARQYSNRGATSMNSNRGSSARAASGGGHRGGGGRGGGGGRR